MKAVILAGGLGSRLKPFTEIIPKPLLPIGEKSVMEVQILRLKKHGFRTIYVATNYMADYVQAFLGDGSKFDLTIKCSREEKPLGTCGPLSLLKEELQEPFVVMNGDILTKLDFEKLYRFGIKQQADLTVATKVISTPFRFGNVQVDENEYIVAVDEKPALNFEVLAGIYFMKPSVFQMIPKNQYYGMDNLIKDMLEESKPISRYQISEYWLDIGQVEDYSKAKSVYKEQFESND